MPFPGRPSKSKHTGDPSQSETSGGPVRGADEDTEDELDALAADVFGVSEPSQDNNVEQPAPSDSSEEGAASNATLDRREGEAAHRSPETSSPPLSQAHIDYHSKPEDELTTETQGSPENPADSSRGASPDLLNVQEAISEAVDDIFQKKVVGDPLVKALIEMHGGVDLRKLAAELGEFATNIGASKRRN